MSMREIIWKLRDHLESLLTSLGLTCLLPMIHILAMSFSSSGAVTRGEVGLVPVEFTLQS